jgi:predicted AlkP superfamily pyrophosphatase or phosphodiesterase
MRTMRLCLSLLAATLALPAAEPPPVLIIALDGFRHDYAALHQAPHLLALAREGASVARFTPVFPSTTFPNFHSMATGLRPARHGLVAMAFHDRTRGRDFHYQHTATEGFWYGGRPIWEIAEEHGILTATYFWPGSDAGINGRYPSYFKRYDPRATHAERVAQVLEWFQLPAAERPGLAIVYFSDVDSAGHRHGPDSPELREAVLRLDAITGELVRRVRALNSAVHIVIASDHGMSAVDRLIDFTRDADLSGCRAANEAPMTMLYCDDPERVRRELLAQPRPYTVERPSELPPHLGFAAHPRIGDLIIRPKGPSIVYAFDPIPPLKGMHGYDPAANPEMDGMLIALGPAFRPGARAANAFTVDLFPLIGHLLGLTLPEDIDGRLSRLQELLRESAPPPRPTPPGRAPSTSARP